MIQPTLNEPIDQQMREKLAAAISAQLGDDKRKLLTKDRIDEIRSFARSVATELQAKIIAHLAKAKLTSPVLASALLNEIVNLALQRDFLAMVVAHQGKREKIIEIYDYFANLVPRVHEEFKKNKLAEREKALLDLLDKVGVTEDNSKGDSPKAFD